MALPERADPLRRSLLATLAVGVPTATLLGAAGMVDYQRKHTQQQLPLPERVQIPDRIHDLPPLPEFKAVEGTRKVAVILLKNPHDQSPDYSIKYPRYNPDDGTTTLLSGMDAFMQQISDKFSDMSGGKLNYEFTVLPHWHTFPQHVDPNDLDTVAKLGDSIFANSKIPDKSKYTTHMYFLPGDRKNKDGGWGGTGNPARTWIYTDGKIAPNNPFYQAVAIHELGHTLGLPHMNDLAYLNLRKHLFTEEYGVGTFMGDVEAVFDFHLQDGTGGQAALGDFAITDKIALGWVGRDRIVDVVQDGIYELDLAELMQGKNLALRIRKDDTDEQYYLACEINPYASGDGTDLYKLGYYVWDEKFEWDDTKTSPRKKLDIRGNGLSDWRNGIHIEDLGYNDDTQKNRVKITFTK